MTPIQPGMVLPDFELPDQDGTMRRLSELQGGNAMVLMLGRGEHCPRERQHQREMVRLHGWCPVAYTSLVTIVPNDLHDVFRLRSSSGAQWPYLADEHLEVQEALGIREYTDPHHAATVPHTVVLSPGLKVEKVYVGFWFWGRPSPEDLWADLRDVFERTMADYDPLTDEARAAFEAAQAVSA